MAYKPMLSALLLERASTPNAAASLSTSLSPVRAVRPVMEDLDLRLSEFAHGQISYELRVPFMVETLWFVPTAAAAKELVRNGVGRGRIWTAEELERLAEIPSIPADVVRRVALLKSVFGAEIEPVPHETAPPPPRRNTGVCRSCHGRRSWRSIYDVVICATCHPPAAPDLVAEWITTAGGVGA